MTKDSLRREILHRRDELTEEEIRQKSIRISKRLMSLEEYSCARNILVYASVRSEVITDMIMEDAIAGGKKVFCPKVTDPKNGGMEFVRIMDVRELTPGAFGIREPGEGEIYDAKSDARDSLVIMPGAAFDADRNRYGYGGGYYDRFMAGHSEIKSVGLAFQCQISGERLEAEEHDMKPSLIVTEERIY